MSTATVSSSVHDHRAAESDDGYPELEQAIHQRVVSLGLTLFTTDCGEALYDEFLAKLPPERRQHYNCRACRRFVETYGSLVEIAEDGAQRSAMWPGIAVPPTFVDAVSHLEHRVRTARVNGVFFAETDKWGEHRSPKGWTHLRGTYNGFVEGRLQTPSQRAAEKLEDRKTLLQGLADYPTDLVRQTVRVLEADALSRAEKTVNIAKWLLELQVKRDATKNKVLRENVVWLAVAKAPAGWCHVRSTMISTLLDDLKLGMAFDKVQERWKAKMHPLQYQRPTAPVKAGNVERAEKIVAELGLASALRRRFARLDEVMSYWRPTVAPKDEKTGGVFDHLKKAKIDVKAIELPPATMTWEKFRRTILNDALDIEYRTPYYRGAYYGMVTQADPDAKPILQWDVVPRNPVSWYFWHGGSTAAEWGLSHSTWVRVNAICECPAHWYDKEKFKHHNEMALLVLEGAREKRSSRGGLFPECVRSELHEIRSVIEAHSQSAEVEGKEVGNANGAAIQKGQDGEHLLRVRTRDGWAQYKIDRWD